LSKEFRANQGETREFFFKTVRLTVSEFVSWASDQDGRGSQPESEGGYSQQEGGGGAEEGWQHHLVVLRGLAAAGPGNIRAAESVAASLASAMIRAAGERSAELLTLHQTAAEKRCEPHLVSFAGIDPLIPFLPFLALLSRHVLSLQDEILSLRKENAELKTGLAKMRKSNVQVAINPDCRTIARNRPLSTCFQLRVRAAATAMLPPSSPTAGGGSVLSQQQDGRLSESEALLSEGEGRTVASGKPSWRPSTEAKSDGGDGDTAAGEVSAAVPAEEELDAAGGTTSMLESGERLPRAVERYLQKELAAHARLVVEGHPLAASVSDAMVDRLTGDLSREVQGIAAAAFFAFLHHRQGLAELPECLLDGSVPSIDEAADSADPPLSAACLRAVSQVREAVDHVLQVSSGKSMWIHAPSCATLTAPPLYDRSSHGAVGAGYAVPHLPALQAQARRGIGAAAAVPGSGGGRAADGCRRARVFARIQRSVGPLRRTRRLRSRERRVRRGGPAAQSGPDSSRRGSDVQECR
jgi:hypothetical protein